MEKDARNEVVPEGSAGADPPAESASINRRDLLRLTLSAGPGSRSTGSSTFRDAGRDEGL